MNRRHLWLLALVLMATGLGLFTYKWRGLGFPLQTEALAEAWTVEARVGFTRARTGPVKAILRLPASPPGFTLLDEQFISRGYGLSLEGEGDERRAVWTLRRAQGEQALYYRATVFRDDFRRAARPVPPFPPVPTLEEPFGTAVKELVDRAREESADIATFASAAMRIINDPTPPESVRLFLGSRAEPMDRARFARTLLEAARIPSEIVQALRLSDERRDARLEPWLAVHNGEEWLYFDPATGQRGLSGDLLVWVYGDQPVVAVDGVRGELASFAVRRTL